MLILPQSPVLVILMLMSLTATLVSIKRKPMMAFSLFLSLVTARVIANYGSDNMHSHVLFVCAFMCVLAYKDSQFKLRSIENNEVGYVVAFLFMLRMVVVLGMDFGLYSDTIMWELSMVLLTVQVLLVLGDSLDAYSKRINNFIGDLRVSTHCNIAARWGLNN